MYNIDKTFEENIAYGPTLNISYPTLPIRRLRSSFLGYKLNSRFGVSACPLTHGARGVSVCSQLGYDIITYRSVRSVEWYGQTYPHWRYASIPKQAKQETLSNVLIGSSKPLPKQEISTVNSFGIQSLKPEYWQADFEIAKKSLLSGQLLILSLMFTPETGKDILSDAANVARYAKQTSAEVFEINLAHPNSGMKSVVYEDIKMSVAICKRVKKILGDRPLLAKVGYYRDPALPALFLAQTKGIIQGVTSANTYSVQIVDKKGNDIFPGRPKAGLSGAAIRTLYMEQANRIVRYKELLKLRNFVIIGVGGVMNPTHIKEYLDLGVDAVQSATGVWADPLLASKYLNTL